MAPCQAGQLQLTSMPQNIASRAGLGVEDRHNLVTVDGGLILLRRPDVRNSDYCSISYIAYFGRRIYVPQAVLPWPEICRHERSTAVTPSVKNETVVTVAQCPWEDKRHTTRSS
jgi:hypothetical protein